jgi:hypothetical protein
VPVFFAAVARRPGRPSAPREEGDARADADARAEEEEEAKRAASRQAARGASHA